MASRRFTVSGSPARTVLVAVAAPALATALAIVLEPDSALGAVPLFLLGVVAAAALGGVWAGIGSSVLGFLSLNYFFTAPRHTFRVAREEDVVALVALEPLHLVLLQREGGVVVHPPQVDRATKSVWRARHMLPASNRSALNYAAGFSSSRFTTVRKRAASAPSTMRWS